MSMVSVRRKVHVAAFHLRQAQVVAKAMKSRSHPIVAHIVPIRRCNLSCAYCNEYDGATRDGKKLRSELCAGSVLLVTERILVK